MNSPFMQIQDQVSLAEKALMEEEKAYEKAFELSRMIIRKTKKAIHGIHVGQRDPELIDSISGDLAVLVESVSAFPKVLYSTNVESAMGEFAETVIYDYALHGQEIPTFLDLDVFPSSWIEGLADAIGELRRDMLTALMSGDVDKARGLFDIMETLYESLNTLDIKEVVAPTRRKQDIARSIMEKSRSDLTAAVTMTRIKTDC